MHVQRKFLLPIIMAIIVSSCGTQAKYTTNFERGRTLDFSKGKWILNKPYSNRDLDNLETIAREGFGKILKDSLFLIDDLRGENLIGDRIPYTPSFHELKDLDIGCPMCDYLINYRVKVNRDELELYNPKPMYGSSIKINEAMVEISIYDISNYELISRTSMVGIADKEIGQDDSGWDFSESATTIAMKALRKLIEQYDRNKE